MTSARVALSRDQSERLVKPLSRILNSGERMTRMIDQLLDFTRVRLGAGLPLSRQPIDLVPLLRQVLDELDDPSSGWTFKLQERGDSRGTWDPDRLSQVFSNLAANAVQHGVAEAGVSVTVDGTDPQVVRASVRNAGAIPEPVLPRIFEPLATGTRSTKKSGGLGLGLYITREIVRAHGGRIDVTSSEADGATTFTVTLPRQKDGNDDGVPMTEPR
jgi:signal transduction histidine kinase